MTNLDLKEMYWSNILSYGDYENYFDFENFGVASVSGTNGVGKSSMMTALLWCLSGKTVKNKVAGDKILNWHTGKNGYVSLITKDGYNITRSRKLAGQDELIIKYNGQDISLSTNQNVQQWLNKHFKFDFDIFISSVFFGQPSESLLEIPEQRRKSALERFFGIDRFNAIAQIAKEKVHDIEVQQADIRAKVDYLTRDCNNVELNIVETTNLSEKWIQDKYCSIAAYEVNIKTINEQIDNLPQYDLDSIKCEWNKYKESSEFVVSLKEAISELNSEIYKHNSDLKYLNDVLAKTNNRLGQVNSIDIDDLTSQHVVQEANNRLRSKLLSLIRTTESELGILLGNINSNKRTIANWEAKSGTTCVTCEQEINADHINNSIAPMNHELELQNIRKNELVTSKTDYTGKLAAIPEQVRLMTIDEANRINNEIVSLDNDRIHKEDRIIDITKEISNLNNKLKALQNRLAIENNKLTPPLISMEEVNKNNYNINLLKSKVKDIQANIDKLTVQENLYDKSLIKLEEKLLTIKDELDKNNKFLAKLDIGYSHIKYVYNSYNDRKKIKSYVLGEYIDILNKKIDYYSDIFQCTARIKFNQSLSIESDKWDADYFSGGERKRLDVAIMLAMGDVYNMLYGPQCNIRVFDEVDGSLDEFGTQKFAEIINDMISNNDYLDSVFVISHKGDLFDAFQRKIKIVKENEFSRIEMIE